MAELNIEGIIGQLSEDEKAQGFKSFSSYDMQAWLDANKGAKEVTVNINSNGGSVTHGYTIRGMLKTLKAAGVKLKTVGYNVKSIATIIFNVGEEREVFRTSEFLAHNPWMDPIQLAGQVMEAADYKDVADDLFNEEEKLIQTYAEDLGLDDKKKNELRKIMKRNQNMPIDEVLSFGFATKIVDGVAEKASAKAVVYSELIMAKVNQNKMKDNKKAEAKNAFSGILSGLKKLAQDAGIIEKKNESTKTADGEIFHDGELAVDSAVFTDAEMTIPVGDGEVILDNGTVVTVAGGIVTAIVEAEANDPKDEQIAALKIANQRLVNEGKEKDTKITALTTENTSLKEVQASTKTQVETLTKQINDFQTTYFKDEVSDDEKKPGVQNFKGDPKQTPHKLDGFKKVAANQYNK
jgi:ATP-dependent protease ClpP protease subunit